MSLFSKAWCRLFATAVISSHSESTLAPRRRQACVTKAPDAADELHTALDHGCAPGLIPASSRKSFQAPTGIGHRPITQERQVSTDTQQASAQRGSVQSRRT
jgi:hypothetical protein